MSGIFEFVATRRELAGKGPSAGIRRAGNVPAIVYGHGEPQMISLNHNDVIKHLAHEEVYSHVLDIVVDGKAEKAILKAVQRHPAKARILHMDFQRVNLSDRLRVHVPLHFVNESTGVGVKKGGVATHTLNDVEIFCLPSNLPDFIEVDLANLDIGESIHLSDLKLPEGVQIVALLQGDDHDLSVVSMQPPKTTEE